MIGRTLDAFGRLDVLINNAGIQKPAPSHEIETTDFDRILSVNLRGPFLCSREAIRHFLSRPGGGVILNNSSVHEIIPKPKYLPYSVSKGGMENLTKSLELEYADRGIRVLSARPVPATLEDVFIALITGGATNAPAPLPAHGPSGR